MSTLTLVGVVLGFGAAAYGVCWLAARVLARWLIRDREARRAARRHGDDGRE